MYVRLCVLLSTSSYPHLSVSRDRTLSSPELVRATLNSSAAAASSYLRVDMVWVFVELTLPCRAASTAEPCVPNQDMHQQEHQQKPIIQGQSLCSQVALANAPRTTQHTEREGNERDTRQWLVPL